MKKIFLIVFLLLGLYGFSQPIVNRSGNANTVVDYRWGSLYNMFAPRYFDTTAANLQKGIDSCGAIIYCYNTNSLWLRKCYPKRWAEVSVGSGGSDTVIVNGNFWGVDGNSFIGSDLSEPSIGVVTSPGDAFGMWFLANGVRSLYFPPNGLSLLNDTTNTKVMTFNPTTKNWGYANWIGGGGSGGSGWSLTGNSGTTAGTNFIGTTDSVDFVVKVSNVQHGLFDIDKKNVGFGYSTLQAVTSLGIGNTGLGSYSLKSVTSGDYNVGLGYNALAGITTGNRNVAVGPFALDSSATNFDLVAIGYQALQKGGTSGTIAIGSGALKNNSSGNTAVAIGYEALNKATQVGNSIAIGTQALYSDTSLLSNIGIGYRALYTNRQYGNNVAIGTSSQNLSNAAMNTSVGAQSLLVNTTGEQLTAFGYNALYSNTTGIKNNAQGTGAMENNTTGSFNTGVGNDVLLQNTEGNYNVGIGWLGWSQNRTGNYNVGIGASSGRSIINGTGNTFVGYQAGYGGGQEDTVDNCVALGYDALTTGSNQFVVSPYITSYKFPGIPSGAGTKALRYDPATDLITIGDTSTATTSLPISSLTAATGTNSIENADYAQTWNWSGLTNHQGLYLLSNGTAASGNNQQLLTVQLAGANANSTQTTKAARFLNGHTGTSSTNIAAEFSATLGTNNYAIIVPASSGSVGIGTSTPSKVFHTVGTVRMESLGTASTDTTTYKPVGINSSGDIIPMTYWPGGGGSGLTVGTTTVGSANSRSVLYSNTGILKDSSIFVFNTGGELQVGSASDAGNYRLQVTGKTYGTDTAFFTSHGRIAGIDIGVYGGSMGIQNNYANTSRPDLYFRTFNGSSTNGNVYFESGSFKMQMMANDASKNQLQVVYGGNTGYFNVGSHTSIYSSSGQELRLGSGGTENQVTIASGRVGINATSPAASAQLEVASTTKGFLPPRMTATQAEAISSPAEGLLIYSTNGTGATITSKGWWGYDGSTWVKLN